MNQKIGPVYGDGDGHEIDTVLHKGAEFQSDAGNPSLAVGYIKETWERVSDRRKRIEELGGDSKTR
jgi:hypothetical protein